MIRVFSLTPNIDMVTWIHNLSDQILTQFLSNFDNLKVGYEGKVYVRNHVLLDTVLPFYLKSYSLGLFEELH